MSVMAVATQLFERMPLPDGMSRLAIAHLVGRTAGKLDRPEHPGDQAFAASMAGFPIAADAGIANQQHYELPPAFFTAMLGAQRKYSSCYYTSDDTTLDEAEETALQLTAAHAGLADGQHILELGCGWGSLTLWMARHFPSARITAVSNAAPQREAILARARSEGLENLNVITADMNSFAAPDLFDRVVSVEMFEHMTNWQALLTRVRTWVKPDGRLFVHVFAHLHTPYRFDAKDPADWIAQHFFTSGVMPSTTLLGQFGTLFNIEESWRWSGTHYARTARDWLARFDAQRPAIDDILKNVYGASAPLWARRWRLFLLATQGLFGHADGEVWGVSHYRLSPRQEGG